MNYDILLLTVYLIALGGSVFALVSYRKLKVAYRWIGVYLLVAGPIQLMSGYIFIKILHIPIGRGGKFIYINLVLLLLFYSILILAVYINKRKKLSR